MCLINWFSYTISPKLWVASNAAATIKIIVQTKFKLLNNLIKVFVWTSVVKKLRRMSPWTQGSVHYLNRHWWLAINKSGQLLTLRASSKTLHCFWAQGAWNHICEYIFGIDNTFTCDCFFMNFSSSNKLRFM